MTLTALSNPFEGELAATADRLARDSFRRALRSVDERAKREGCAPPGIDVGAGGASSPSVTCWTPELGAVGFGLRADRARPCWQWLAAQTNVAAIVLGLIEAVEVTFAGDHPLAIAGHFVRGARLCVEGDAERLTVRDGDGDVLLALARTRRDGAAPLWVAREDDVLPLGEGGAAVASKGEWIHYWQNGRGEGLRLEYAEDFAGFRRKLRDAMQLLQSLRPEYHAWVRLVLHEVVPLKEAPPGRRNSASSAMWPGLVYLDESSPVAMIDALVHECSHQYFAMLLWRGPLVTADAPSGYSVLKRENRTLDRILCGFHAVGNSVLAYALLRDSLDGNGRGEADAVLSKQSALLADLDGVLQEKGTRYLTAAGQSLYLPLRRRLVEAEWLKAA